ncbi:MAG: TetR/AcrR family transcriptional regulator [Novosphingobium sp.]
MGTKNILIEAMASSLQEHGYRSTSTTDVLALTGVSRGSLYFHFPGGKEALAAAAVHASGGRMTNWITTEFADGPDASAATCRLIDGFAAALDASQFTKGCPVALSALEVGEQEPVLQAAIRAVYAEWQSAIGAGLVARGMEPDAAERLSELALIQIEGALLLARVSKSIKPLMLAKAVLADAIGETL